MSIKAHQHKLRDGHTAFRGYYRQGDKWVGVKNADHRFVAFRTREAALEAARYTAAKQGE